MGSFTIKRTNKEDAFVSLYASLGFAVLLLINQLFVFNYKLEFLQIFILFVLIIYALYDLTNLWKDIKTSNRLPISGNLFPFKKQYNGVLRLLFWSLFLLFPAQLFFAAPSTHTKLRALVYSVFLSLYLIRFIARKLTNYHKIILKADTLSVYQEKKPFKDEVIELDLSKADRLEIEESKGVKKLTIVGFGNRLVINVKHIEKDLQDKLIDIMKQRATENNLTIKHA